MRRIGMTFAALACTVLPLAAQGVRPAVGEEPQIHRLEVYTGGRLRVRYYSRGLLPSERALLRSLEAEENEPAPEAGTLLARARVAGSARLCAALGLRVAAASGEGSPDAPVVITLRGGEKLGGVRLEERGGWAVLHGKGGKTLRVRASDVIRIEERPARDDG